MKPPFSYYGGKTTLAPRIAALLPPHRHYVEPFAGSLAVLLAKPPSLMETVNDADGDLMTFWRVLRDRRDDLVRVCGLTPHARAEQQLAYRPADDDLERARRIWVLLSQGRGGVTGRRSGWRHFRDTEAQSQSMAAQLDSYVARMLPAAVRLKGVSLECLDSAEVIRLYGANPDALVYADPPYLGTARPGSANEYRHRHELPTSTTQGGVGSPRTEVLWSNRPLGKQLELFAQTMEAQS